LAASSTGGEAVNSVGTALAGAGGAACAEIAVSAAKPIQVAVAVRMDQSLLFFSAIIAKSLPLRVDGMNAFSVLSR